MVGIASLQVYLRLWVCLGDLQQDGLLPVFSVRSVPKTASSHDDVHLHIPVRRVGFPALDLVRNPKSLERAGDHGEKRLVLVYLHPDSGADAYVSGVHDDCIAAGTPTSLPSVLRPPLSAFQFPRIMMRV